MNRRKQKGIGIAVVLCLLGVLSVMCLSLGTIGVSNLNTLKVYSDNMIARYAAIQGLNEACDRLSNNAAWTSGFSGVNQNSGPGKYTVTFSTSLSYYSTNNNSGTSTVSGWGGFSVPSGYVYLVSTGEVNGRKQRVAGLIKAPSSSLPPWNYAIFCDGDMDLRGNGVVNSYNSRTDSYPFACTGTVADIGTNSNSSGTAIQVGGTADVDGSAYVGANTTWSASGSIGGSGSVSGTLTNLSSPVSMPVISDFVTLSACTGTSDTSITANCTISPTSISGGVRNITISASGHGAHAVNPTVTINSGSYGDITIEDDSVVTLVPPIRCNTITCNSKTTFNAGNYSFETINGAPKVTTTSAPGDSDVVKIYIRGSSTKNSADMSGNILVNTTHKARKVQIYCSSLITSITMNGGAEACYALYAPNATAKFNGNAKFYGSVVCKNLDKLNGTFDFHYDVDLKEMIEAGGTTYANVKSIWYLQN